MILSDSIQDATTMKKVVSSLIRRADTFGKTRDDILLELSMMVNDIETSIDRMDADYSEAYAE